MTAPSTPGAVVTHARQTRRPGATRRFAADVGGEIAARRGRLTVAAALLTLAAAVAVATYPLGVWLLALSNGSHL